MKTFSWKKINDKFEWNPQSVLEYFYLKQNIVIPPNLKRKIPETVKHFAKHPYPSGSCFVLNLDKVLENASSPSDLYIYLELASERNKFDYFMRGVKYLPLVMLHDYLYDWVKINPMLKIIDDKIHFKYEQE